MLSVKRKQIIINQNKYFLPQYIYKKSDLPLQKVI